MGIKETFLCWIIFTDYINCFQCNSASVCYVPLEHENKSTACQDGHPILSCEPNKVIMITDIRYAKKTLNRDISCDDCFPYSSAKEWSVKPVFFKSRLFENCSKRNSCNIANETETPTGERNYIWYACISYDCVSTALFSDVCSSWETTLENESRHIALRHDWSSPQVCNCIIDWNSGHGGIEIVDYRPYLNDYVCAGTSVLIDENPLSECSDKTGIDVSMFNTPLNVTSKTTNITVIIQSTLPQMFWLKLTGDYVIVQCNNGSNESENWTSIITSIATEPSAHTISTISFETVTDHLNSTPTEHIPTINTSFSYDRSYKSTFFTTSNIAWAAAGLVVFLTIVIVLSCIVRRRISQSPSYTKNKEDINTEIESNAGNSRLMNGLINNSYVDGCEMIDITLNSSNNKEIDDTTNVYSVPADGIEVDCYAEATAAYGNIRSSPSAKKEVTVHNYKDPYDKTLLIRDTDKCSSDTKIIKDMEKKDIYNTLSGIDNYSHVHVSANIKGPRNDDKYSHIKIGQGEHSKIHGGLIDMYTHTTVNNCQETVNCQDANASLETEDYDHLSHYSHH